MLSLRDIERKQFQFIIENSFERIVAGSVRFLSLLHNSCIVHCIQYNMTITQILVTPFK